MFWFAPTPKSFQETYRLLCSEPNNENGLFPEATTKLAPTTTTKLSTIPITKTTFIQPSTETQLLKELLPSTLATSTVSLDSTKIREQAYTVCCHRPKTWETTTETAKTFIFFASSIDNQNTVELDKSDENSLQKETITTETTPETTRQSTAKLKATLLTESTSTTKQTTTKQTTTTTAVVTKVTPPKTIPSTKIVHPTTVSVKDTFSPTTLSETVTLTKIINSTKTFTESCQNKTSETPTVSSKCCERPGTWETTTEKEAEYSTEPLNIIESSTTTTTSTSTTTTTVAPTLVKVPPFKLHIEITTADTTDDTPVQVTEVTSKKYSPIESDSSYLSDRDDEVSNYIPDDVPIKSITPKSSTYTTKTFKTSTRPAIYAPSFIEETSATHTTNKQIDESRTISKEIVEKRIKLKSIKPHTRQSSYHWWYPKPCKSKKCQRPVTWETTTKRHKKYYGHH